MKALLNSVLHLIRTSLAYLLASPPDWLTWLILTALLALPIYLVLRIFGFGSGPRRTRSGEDVLDRIVSSTDEIPEARWVTRSRK